MSQLHSFSVLQALTMNRHLGSGSFQIPAASFSVFSQLVIIAWMPLYDRFIVPAARRMTKNGRGITVFHRMGIGYAISTLSMVVSGFIEVKRRNTALGHGLANDSSAIVPISALWLVPQFCIMGLGEAFHTVGHLEFFYAEFPPTMRSTAIALSSCTSAVGQYMSTILLNVVHAKTGRHGKPDWLNDNLNLGRLNYLYWLLAAIEAVNLVYFIICASLYKYTEFPVQDPVFESGAQEMESKLTQENEPVCKIAS
ncbi:protein NRT1/ PTR FAMILY 3.1 [Cryptomeria japonica]|uniref:protein NRT1/ PTR FAMILY 3.1 n=1 Tax=Cryptomeria japonica TaxID=3369 RepID=UPI0027DA1FA9|nr:protein NRT1/ PTR FAMILY 3.1 [Cryptomeria japonica]